MSPRTCVIFNPAARSGEAAALMEDIQRSEELEGRPLALRQTRRRGQATLLARQAVLDGFHTIVAAGGDGTINEVVNGIGLSGATLGILPFGTLNVLALELGIPADDPAEAWRIIRRGHIRKIDLPAANGIHFLHVAGIGMDARIFHETDTDTRRLLGPLSYLIPAWSVIGSPAPDLRASVDGSTPVPGKFILVGNGRYYAGPHEVFKGKRLDDGTLDIYIFQNSGYLDVLRYIAGVLTQTQDDFHDVQVLRGTDVSIETDQPHSVPFQLDGEVAGLAPVDINLFPAALSLLAPEDPATAHPWLLE